MFLFFFPEKSGLFNHWNAFIQQNRHHVEKSHAFIFICKKQKLYIYTAIVVSGFKQNNWTIFFLSLIKTHVRLKWRLLLGQFEIKCPEKKIPEDWFCLFISNITVYGFYKPCRAVFIYLFVFVFIYLFSF